MITHQVSLSARAQHVAAGHCFCEGTLRAASAQLARLALALQIGHRTAQTTGALSDPMAGSVAFPQRILNACAKHGVNIKSDDEMQLQEERLRNGAHAALSLAQGLESDSLRNTLQDALLVLDACEKEELLSEPQQHIEAHIALANGEWDNKKLMAIGPLHVDPASRRRQVDQHYVKIDLDEYVRRQQELEAKSTNTPPRPRG